MEIGKHVALCYAPLVRGTKCVMPIQETCIRAGQEGVCLQGDRSTNPFAVGDDVVIEFHGEDEPPLIVGARSAAMPSCAARSICPSKATLLPPT